MQSAASQIEDLLDKLSVPLTGEELEMIEKLYSKAVKLEIDFFLGQPISQPTVVPLTRSHDPLVKRLILCSDFDLTCTVLDSSAVLAEIAILRTSSDSNPRNSSDLRNFWDNLSTLYTEEYEQCVETMLTSREGWDTDEKLMRSIY